MSLGRDGLLQTAGTLAEALAERRTGPCAGQKAPPQVAVPLQRWMAMSSFSCLGVAQIRGRADSSHRRVAAKRAASKLSRGANRLGLLPGLEDLASYLHVLIGQGADAVVGESEPLMAASLLRGSAAPVVVDVGANVGAWTTAVRRLLGHHRGTWILFEPCPQFADRLRRIPNAELIEAAAGENDTQLTLYAPNSPSGWVTLHERRDSFTRGVTFIEHQVHVTRIEDRLAERGIDRVDFMKVDVEGHELFVLRGLGDYLKEARIGALSFEFGSANVNSRTFFHDFWDLLTPLGYRFSRLTPGGPLVPVPEYDETLEFFRGASNYVAMSPDVASRVSLSTG
jgi:FkbM family methyltransferase